MKRPNRSLDSLFDAARHEASPLSQDDVRSLLEQPSKKKRSPIMLPMIVSTALVAIAGFTTAVVMQQDAPQQPQTVVVNSSLPASVKTRDTPVTIKTTVVGEDANKDRPNIIVKFTKPHDSINGTDSADILVLSVVSDVVDVADVSDAVDVANESDVLDVANESDISTPQIITRRIVFKDNHHGTNKNAMFVSVRADRQVMNNLAGKSAPMPVILTDTRGRIRHASSDAFFSRESIDVNALIPLAVKSADFPHQSIDLPYEIVDLPYERVDELLAWYEPSMTLVRAFPDSMRDELETLLDINVDIDLDIDWPSLDTASRNKIKTIELSNLELTMHRLLGNTDSTLTAQKFGSNDSLSTSEFNIRMDSKKLLFNKMADSMHLKTTIMTDSMARKMGFRVTIDSVFDASQQKFIIRKLYGTDTTFSNSTRLKRFKSRIIIQSNIKRNKNNTRKDELASVEKLSELTPTSNGAIASTSVYPNPVTDGGATMSYELTQARTLTLTLLDLGGNIVATLMKDARRTPGKGQFAFALSNIPAGMYIVSLTSDKGERAIQRLIVQ